MTSFDTELFAEPLDYFRLVLEIIFVGLLVLQLINEVYEMLTLARGEDNLWSEPFAYCGILGTRTGSCHLSMTGLWNMFDIGSIVVFMVYFTMWWSYIIFHAIPFAPVIRYNVYSDLNAKGHILNVNEDGLAAMENLFLQVEALNSYLHLVAIISVLNIISM